MKKIICEACGSNDIVKKDGFFVCQACGTKYSDERVGQMPDGMGIMSYEKALFDCKVTADREDYDKAVEGYEELIGLYPDRTEAYMELIALKGKYGRNAAKEYAALKKLLEENTECDEQETERLSRYIKNGQLKDIKRLMLEAERKSANYLSASMAAFTGTMVAIIATVVFARGRLFFWVLGAIVTGLFLLFAIGWRKESRIEGQNAKTYKKQIAELKPEKEESGKQSS